MLIAEPEQGPRPVRAVVGGVAGSTGGDRAG